MKQEKPVTHSEYMSYQNAGAGNALAQQGSSPAYQLQQDAIGRQLDLFDQLRDAQAAYAKACHARRDAEINRSEAAARLKELSEKASGLIACAMEDPTVPQDTANPRANGRY